MRKFTKLMLTLALVFGAVGGVNSVKASKLYADLSKLSNGPASTWDGATNTMQWIGTSNNMISNFNFAAGSYRAYSTISITVSDLTNAVGVRLQIRANGQEKLVALNGNGTFTKYLVDDFGFTASDLTKVEWIRVLGSAWQNGESHTIDADHPASAVISDVYLTQPTNTLEVNLSKMAASEGEATWNYSTKIFAWTLNYGNAITLPGLSGSLSSYTTVKYETAAGTSDQFRILIYYNNGAPQTTYVASVGNKSVTFKEMGASTENLSHVSSIKIAGASTASGDIILNSFSLEGSSVNYIENATVLETPVGVTDINGMTGADSNKWNIAYPLTVGDGTQFGGNIDGDNKSVDISSYDYLLFVVSDASKDAKTGLRVFVSTASSDNNSTRVILYPHPIADYADVTDWTAQSFITSSGFYVVKISDYPLLRGIKNLAYWQGSAGTINISQAYVGTGSPAAPVENIVVVGEDAVSDANATSFDVTCLSGSGITYSPANPNVLFIANAGQLTNTKNVIVGTTCANLEIADGYPFKAPKNFTATAAPTYDRSFVADKTTTVCLPFALTETEAETLGTFYELSSFDGGTIHLSPVAEPEANKAYLVVPTATGLTLSEAGKSIAATPADLGAEITSVEFIGTLASTSIPASDGTNSYFAFNNGSLVKIATKAATLPAFRGYFKVSTSAIGARSLNISFDEETTGVKTIDSKLFGVSKYFDLQGRRVENPTKGLYIVNGKKVVK